MILMTFRGNPYSAVICHGQFLWIQSKAFVKVMNVCTVLLTHCVHVNCTIRQDLKEAGVSWRKNKSTVLTEKIGINVSLTWAEWTVSMDIVKSFCKVC